MVRRCTLLFAVLLMVTATGCSSGGLSVEIVREDTGGGTESVFAATGAAVDGEAICDSGTTGTARLKSTDGDDIYEEEWFAIFDTAMEDGTVAEMDDIRRWTCADGSGSFQLTHHTRIDMATFQFAGVQQVGTWEISDGTGELAGLSGSGDVTVDIESSVVTYTGEVSSG